MSNTNDKTLIEHIKKEFNPKELFAKIIVGLFYILVIFSFMINFIFFMLMFGSSTDLGILGTARTVLAYQYEPQARSLAVNLTHGCRSDIKCSFDRIATYVSEFNYCSDGNMNARLYPIDQMVNDKCGDCEGLSFLFVKLFTEVGGTAIIKNNDCHAWVEVMLSEHPLHTKAEDRFIFETTTGKVYAYDKSIIAEFDMMCK